MAERKISKVKYGNTERMSFAQIHEVIDMPDLVEVQKKSYNDFIENGIREVLRDFSPITDYSNRVELFSRITISDTRTAAIKSAIIMKRNAKTAMRRLPFLCT